jgi:hypothetical protein
VGDLWAVAVAAILAAAFNARIARQLWLGKMDFRNRGDESLVTDIPESRRRVNSTMVANALAVSSFALFVLLTSAADSIGHTTFGRIVLVVGSCAGAAFIVFIGIGISIYFTNKPSRLVPPVLRNRSIQH